MMDLNALCDRCNAFDVGAVGFVGPDRPLHQRPHVYGLRDRTLGEIMHNLERCILCRKIAEFFSEWNLRQQPQASPNFQNVNVQVVPYPLESSDGKARLLRIHVTLSFPDPSAELGKVYISMQFQKCSQHPPEVSELCKRESLIDWESGEEHAYSARLRPLVADTILFRKWKESCCAMHGDPCSITFTGGRPAGLRLVDVEKRCVVDSEDDSSYTALSYVWGGAKLPELRSSTDERFRQVGSLGTEVLPSTIDDAIQVTRGLGEKYIWVDCLCIMQDDDADKLKFFPQMDSIFGFASVTIVAAAGKDANAGLPGIKPGSRTREQIPFTMKDVLLLRTLDPERSDQSYEFREERRPSYLAEFEWYRRGWTFQEMLFSGRALIFTPEQTYWQCQKASWREDSLWEITNSPTIYRHCFSSVELRHPWASDVSSFEKIYRKVVEEYSTRSLTHERDRLDAFGGILQALKRQAGQTFLWALPTSFLGSALTWPCESLSERRNDCHTLRSSDGTSTLCPFPSWSWVGWKGKVRLISKYGRLIWPTVGLIFYYLDGSGSIVQAPAFPESLLVSRERKLESKIKDIITSPAFVWKDHQSMTIKDVPENVRKRSVASNILLFWSCSAKLHVRRGVENSGEKEIVISTDKGRVLFGSWHHVPLLDPGHGELAEFIVIGIENPHYDEGLLTLLLISLDSDGVAYRRGLVNIVPSDWAEPDVNREWKRIFLG